jgi:MarR family transcriptional regulator, organic hydroperoxide resistance regulator
MTAILQKSAAEAGLEREVYNLLFQHFQAEKENWSAGCQEFDLTLPQSHLLRSLTPTTPIKMNVLAEALHCDASNITGLVDKLEARGIIQRQSDPGDRRVKMIALTQAGIKFRAKLMERLSQPSSSITGLSLTDKRSLRRIVRQMVEAATRAQGLEKGR